VSDPGSYISNFISGYERQEHMLGSLDDTPFVDKNKPVINIFSLGKKITSSHPPHIFW
jgi:hypothetical protein